MPGELFIWLDWKDLLRGPPAPLHARCVAQGMAGPSQAETLRVGICRAAALDHGRNPTALFLHLIRDRNATFALRFEDAARQSLAATAPRPVADTPDTTEPTALAQCLGKYQPENIS